jgi:nucleoside-diphosphate-sugar epimerase
MQIGVIGLGRVGGNMSRRLIKAGHHCIVFDANAQPREALAKEGAIAVNSLEDLFRAQTERPRPIWVTLPAGQITGYETLLYEVMIGDPTLFMRADMVEQTRRIVQPVLDSWAEKGAADLAIYPAGSSGPREADALLMQDGRQWRSVHGDTDGQSS